MKPWKPSADGQARFDSAKIIGESRYNRLVWLKEKTGGWFFVRGDELIFVTVKEWEKVKSVTRTNLGLASLGDVPIPAD
jgi:hypothetical protein